MNVTGPEAMDAYRHAIREEFGADIDADIQLVVQEVEDNQVINVGVVMLGRVNNFSVSKYYPKHTLHFAAGEGMPPVEFITGEILEFVERLVEMVLEGEPEQ